MPLYHLKEVTVKRQGAGPRSNDVSIDIVAVHGLEENSTQAWTDPETNILWLRDLLPEPLSVARVLTFDYNASATSFYGHRSADRIQQHAQTLVAEMQADRQLEDCVQRPVVFICHGLGGILVKKALAYSSTRTSKHVEHLYSIFVSTYAILFFGTPHLGTNRGNWLVPRAQGNDQMGSGEDSQLLSAVQCDSETLQAINDQFAPLMKQYHIFFFWEEVETKHEDQEAFVVEESSAAPIIDNTERAGIHGDHTQMVRFSDRRDSSYRTVVEALTRYCREAAPVISRRWQQAAEAITRVWSNEAYELTGTAFDIHDNNRPFHFERKISERPRNRHFHIPQVVSSIFTGREETTRVVEDAFWGPQDPELSPQQRRYIIHGIGGSGKTQFCSKFAQDHRERFWGVFWIDATSAETAKQSFASIGKLGEMEATKSAGKHWLSNLEESWLLIINNADAPNLDLTDLFPEGERGYILVTTRNPNFRIHGTVGSTEFKGLKQSDALLLLLRAADAPRPWSSSVEDVGYKITDALGCLALALVQAGALILQRMCEIGDYLDFYSKYREKIRARRSSLPSNKEDQFTVYATWEHSLDSLELRRTEASIDAVQLLNTVAFFHFEHIRVDIFTRALANKVRAGPDIAKRSVSARLLKWVSTRLEPPPILPDYLRQGPADPDRYRIRRALHELSSFSLISYDGKDDSFSLHPVVHAWARDRLEGGAQVLWAQVALNVLAESIRLPPDDAGEEHENYRRDILTHLNLCLKARPIEIPNYEALFGGLKFPIALIVKHSWLFVFRNQVIIAAKCGYVYAERGLFQQAAELLANVKDALVQSRGYENDMTMKTMLGLAGVYWGLGRLEEAIALQKIVVDARIRTCGPNHGETLSAKDHLGRSFWLNGQYKEALELQVDTMERAKAVLGSTHEITIMSMDNLGVTYGSWQRYEESRDLHDLVIAARTKNLGPTHLDTLMAKNNLAMAVKYLGELDRARKLMAEVYVQRKAKLGKEHPFTLWALCNLAKVNTELELFREAEDMLVEGVAAAKRSLGEDHPGVLMGVGELARLMARQGRFSEAENVSTDLLTRLEYSRGPEHPDTVYALFKVAQLHEMQNNIDKAIEACALAGERAKIKLTKKHPMFQEISLQLEILVQRRTPAKKPLYPIHEEERLPSHHRIEHRYVRNSTW